MALMQQHTFNHPPIQEALINVKLGFLEKHTVERLEAVYDAVKEEFPSKNYSKSMTVNITPNEEASFDTNEVDGMVLRSPDGSKAVQISNEGYIFSYVQHYSEWEEFLAEALKYLEVVIEKLNASTASGALTRFINNVSVPNDDYKTGSYFSTKIKFAGKDQQPAQYFVQYIEDKGDVACNVIQTRNSNTRSEATIDVILDIEAVYTSSISMEDVVNTDSVIWKRLRQVKNEIFHETLTDKAKESFDE